MLHFRFVLITSQLFSPAIEEALWTWRVKLHWPSFVRWHSALLHATFQCHGRTIHVFWFTNVQAVELDFSIRYSWRLHIFVHRSCSFQHPSTRHDAQVVPRHSLPARVQEQPSVCWRSFGQRLCFAGRWWSVSWTLGASWGSGGPLQLEKIY